MLWEGPRSEKEEALKRAVDLAPKIREELGQSWLEQSFTKHPERGMDILATLGALMAQGIQNNPMSPDFRLKEMQLQKTAIEALLKAAPARAAEWRTTLQTLATGWLKEAEFSRQFDRSSSLGPRVRRDPFGNIYFDDDEPDPRMMMMQRQGEMPQPIAAGDVLKNRPGEAWLNLVGEELKPRLLHLYAQLYLKVNEEALAFPFIEQLAPDAGRTPVGQGQAAAGSESVGPRPGARPGGPARPESAWLRGDQDR